MKKVFEILNFIFEIFCWFMFVWLSLKHNISLDDIKNMVFFGLVGFSLEISRQFENLKNDE